MARRKNVIDLKPARTKFQRLHKGNFAYLEHRKASCSLIHGAHGLQVLQPQRLTGVQLDAARRKISRHMKGKEKIWIRCIPDIPFTAKPIQIRMGKGKGAFSYWAFRLKAGRILFEVGELSKKRASDLFLQAKNTIGVPCCQVTRDVLQRPTFLF